MPWLILAVAAVLEAGWAIAMKLSHGLTRPGWTVAFILGALASMGLLALATKKIDVGTGYAVWAGSGAALIAVFGIFYFKEPATPLRLLSLALVIVGVVGLKLTSR